MQSGNTITISSFGYSKSNTKAGKHPSRAGQVFATANLEIGTATSEKNAHEATGWTKAGTRAGDTGSGAVVQKSGRYFLAGIVSRNNTKSIVMDVPQQAAKICNIYNICS
ncbi:unnamed protein product [Caenorhabditis nigoni]